MADKDVKRIEFVCCAPLGGCKNAGRKFDIFKARTFANREQVEKKIGRPVVSVEDLKDVAVCPDCAERLMKAAEREAEAKNLKIDAKSVLIWIDVIRRRLEDRAAEKAAEKRQEEEDRKALGTLGDLVGFQAAIEKVAPVAQLPVAKPAEKAATKPKQPRGVKKAAANAG